MNYKETLDYLFARLPMYQRDGPIAFKKDLGNIIELCARIGNPQDQFRSIHVAGTNGKGSVSHLLGSILQEFGYKVGLYTSPHYRDFRERIKINGKLISKKEVINFVCKIKPSLERLQASFFELTVAMAFEYFSMHEVDFAIIETGLGGRLDSTNIIHPELSVITNISFDHENMLGNTLELIAGEKAGIIKKEVPVIVGQDLPETRQVFVQKAEDMGSELIFAEQVCFMELCPVDVDGPMVCYQYSMKGKENLVLNLLPAGPFQPENIRTALVAAISLENKGIINWEPNRLRRAVENLEKNTYYIGRWVELGENPLIIADSAHNEAGLSRIIERLKLFNKPQIHFVLGFVNDKNIEKLLKLFPIDARYYFAKANIPRGLDREELKNLASNMNLKGKSYVTVKNALKAAKRAAKKDDLIFVGGSIFVVAEVI